MDEQAGQVLGAPPPCSLSWQLWLIFRQAQVVALLKALQLGKARALVAAQRAPVWEGWHAAAAAASGDLGPAWSAQVCPLGSLARQHMGWRTERTVLLQAWARHLQAAEKQAALFPRDGRVLKPVPKGLRLGQRQLADHLLAAVRQDACKLRESRRLFCSAWGQGARHTRTPPPPRLPQYSCHSWANDLLPLQGAVRARLRLHWRAAGHTAGQGWEVWP